MKHMSGARRRIAAVRGPGRGRRAHPRRLRRLHAGGGATTAAPKDSTPIEAALEEGGEITYWTVDAAGRGPGRRVRGGLPERHGQPRQRRHRQRPVHQAAERDQGRLRRARRRADRVLRLPAVRPDRLARSTWRRTASATSRTTTPPRRGARSPSTTRSTGCRRTPAPWRCSTTRPSSTSSASPCPTTWDEYIAARRDAPRRRPDEVHHQRHRRRGLHHQHDLAGGRSAVPVDRHGRHDRPAGRGLEEVGRHVEPARRERAGRPVRQLERRVVPGLSATAASRRS